eukprot:6194030-Pleurochrysis_carterae.AAC.3
MKANGALDIAMVRWIGFAQCIHAHNADDVLWASVYEDKDRPFLIFLSASQSQINGRFPAVRSEFGANDK